MIVKTLTLKGLTHAKELTKHLSNTEENEKVEVFSTLEDESVEAIVKRSRENRKKFGKRAKNEVLHVIVNPARELNAEEWERVWEKIHEEFRELDYANFIEYTHVKNGSVHKHRVYTWTNEVGENIDSSYMVKRAMRVAIELEKELESEIQKGKRLRWDRLTPREVEILKAKGETREEYLRKKAQLSLEKGYTTDKFEVELTKAFIEGRLTLQQVRELYNSPKPQPQPEPQPEPKPQPKSQPKPQKREKKITEEFKLYEKLEGVKDIRGLVSLINEFFEFLYSKKLRIDEEKLEKAIIEEFNRIHNANLTFKELELEKRNVDMEIKERVRKLIQMFYTGENMSNIVEDIEGKSIEWER